MPEEQLPETMNAVTAVNLALRGTEGPVFGPLTFTAPASGLTVLSGRGGSGRTALALTLAGRMASTTGHRPGRNEAVKNPPDGGRRWRGTD